MYLIKCFYFMIKFFWAKKIIIISSTLQIINLSEYLYKKKKTLDNYIIISPYASPNAFYKINYYSKKFISKKNNLIRIDESIIKLLYFIFYFRKILNLKIDNLIIGNFNSYLNQKFASISENVIVLDDGTNFLDKPYRNLVKKSKFNFFSFYEKNFFPKNNYIKNDFKLLKKKFNLNKKKSDKILILGKPFLEFGWLTEKQHDKVFKLINKIYKNKKINYFPHPTEKLLRLKNFNSLKIIKSKYPAEVFILKENKYPSEIISFNSSVVIPIKIFNNKIKVTNFFIDYKNKREMLDQWKSTFHGSIKLKLYKREHEIVKYFTKFSIKTKKIFI